MEVKKNFTVKSIDKVLDKLTESEGSEFSTREIYVDTQVDWNSLKSVLAWLDKHGIAEFSEKDGKYFWKYRDVLGGIDV